MNIKRLILGYLDTNVYILTIDNEAIIIDPADDFNTIKKELKDYKVVGCLLTHYHPDHMGALEEVLSTLTEREQRVLRLRFGLDDGQCRTLEEVGQIFGVTRERIRQIEAKALRKLRHPSRSRKLKDFLID